MIAEHGGGNGDDVHFNFRAIDIIVNEDDY